MRLLLALFLGLASPARAEPEHSLAAQTATLGGLSLGVMGLLWSLPAEESQWYDKPELMPRSLGGRWKENVKSGPVWDSDMRFFNGYGHIHSGAAYTVLCLETGASALGCTIYANAVSLSWEFGPEAVVEKPSSQDILMTGMVGSRVGLQFFRWKKSIRDGGHALLGSTVLGRTTEFVLDPFGVSINGILNVFGGSRVESAALPFIEPGRFGYLWTLRF